MAGQGKEATLYAWADDIPWRCSPPHAKPSQLLYGALTFKQRFAAESPNPADRCRSREELGE